jgi:hypothetical protein
MENPAGINPFLDWVTNDGFAPEEHATIHPSHRGGGQRTPVNSGRIAELMTDNDR